MLKKIASTLTVFLILAVGFLTPSPAYAQVQAQPVWTGRCVDAVYTDVATIQGLECLIANVLTVAMTLIGLAGFALIIIGAFKYMVSGGSTKEIESARNTISFVVVGIVVALSAFIILNLITAFTGVGIIQQFRIPDSSEGISGG